MHKMDSFNVALYKECPIETEFFYVVETLQN